MKNLLIVLALVTVFAFATNAQSKDCCSKEKGETTKVEKCTDKDHTMKTGDVQKNTSTTSAGLKDGKEVVVTKVEKKENCGDKTSCCDVKKEKTTEKVEKEVEKKETN